MTDEEKAALEVEMETIKLEIDNEVTTIRIDEKKKKELFSNIGESIEDLITQNYSIPDSYMQEWNSIIKPIQDDIDKTLQEIEQNKLSQKGGFWGGLKKGAKTVTLKITQSSLEGKKKEALSRIGQFIYENRI